MRRISKARLTAPKAVEGEIVRTELVSSVLQSNKKLTYIQAGAGYGKTTLLSEIANARKNVVWLTLDGESELLFFTRILTEALSVRFPDVSFLPSEYLPFENKENYITILANAFISAIERITEDFMLILDDLHTIGSEQIKKFIVCLIKYKPVHVHLCFSSREAIWPDLLPLRVRGNILELSRKELRFTRDEVSLVFGFFDEHIYNITQGWPLAIGCYKMLLESGASLEDIVTQANDVLYAYLFYECLSRLPSETVNFLKTTAYFIALDVQMLDPVLGIKNSKLILESLVTRNIFTIKTSNGQYRYHPLFREYLKEDANSLEMIDLLNKAAFYYYNHQHYDEAAENAILSGNKELLQDIILAGYKDYINSGSFDKLRSWFNDLEPTEISVRHEVLVAKGAFLSSIGNFSEAKACLDLVIPLLGESNNELYIEAMIHKARVLRNFVSFQASNEFLDELAAKIEGCSMAVLYKVVIEKLYNLCWNSQIREAYEIANANIEKCARAGDTKTKAWFERYLTAIHFFAGRMKDVVCSYEKSLELPEQERFYLDLHNIGMYAAKAYQMMGDENKAISLITMELQKLRSAGRYEEMWAAYLTAAEIHYHAVFVNRANGSSESYETAIKYFTLADDYAPLYRQTEFQKISAKMYRLICSIMFSDESKEPYIEEILANLDRIGDYIKTLILGRLYGYYAAVGDFKRAVKYARLSIEIGEKSDLMLIASVAYSVLAKAAIAMNDHPQALVFTKRFMELCRDRGIYDYLRMKHSYGPLLEFALENNITPDFTHKMLLFSGHKFKKAYISTMGDFSVSPYKKREEPIKMRSKKERELLAFLLDRGTEGATKDRISEALWSDSESDDVKKLIGVNLTHLNKDLAKLGLENPVINFNKHYSICRDEIEYDTDPLESAIHEFRKDRSLEAAQKILTLYKGEYLADFEALWAIKKRINYRDAYEAALKHCVK